MTTTTRKTTAPKAPKVDAMLTFWELMTDTSSEAMFAIGLEAGTIDHMLDASPLAYATKCKEIAGACLYGPRGTQAQIIKGIEGAGFTKASAKQAVVRFGHVGRILIAQPDLDALAVRTFVNNNTVAEVERAINTGDLTKPKAKPAKPAKPASRGVAKVSTKDITLRAQVIATTQANTKCITMAKVPVEIPVEELKMLIVSLKATLKAAEGMLAVAQPAKVTKVVA